MIETFKLVQGIEDVDASKFFTFSSNKHDHATRQATTVSEDAVIPSVGLVKGPSRLDIRTHFFSQRVVNPWNNLPVDVQNSTSVNLFKNNYDRWLSRQYTT